MTRCLPSRHGLAGASFSDQGPGRPRNAGPGPVRGKPFGSRGPALYLGLAVFGPQTPRNERGIMAQGDLVGRMLGAAKLDVQTYEEVEADTTATGQAAAVVAMAAVASAIASSNAGLGALIFAPVWQILGWLIWAGVTYLIGDKLFGGTATWGELLRTLGFAQAPSLLLVFAFLPLLGGLLKIVVGIWVLIAGVIAIRQALDFSTGKAILTALIGWLVLFIPMALLGMMAASLGGVS